MKEKNIFYKIQLFLPITLSLALAVGLFVDLREFISFRIPSSLIMIALAVMIIWSVINVFYYKNKLQTLIIFSSLTIIPFIVVDIITSAGWLAVFSGSLFITIPLIASSVMWFLVSLLRR